jgi:SPP1 family predicted phage head-tail adaptor
MLNKRVTVAKRVQGESRTFGDGGDRYEIVGTFWAAESFNKGLKSLREGALDAYDTVMFRMRYHEEIDRWCVIQYLGKWYQILSFNADYQENQIQITAQEMANQSLPLAPSQGGGTS